MIEANQTMFPNNIVSLVVTRSQLLDNDLFVTPRPLRATDPNQSIGVVASMWTPEEESREFQGTARTAQPTLSRYMVAVQCLIRDTEEERGLNTHAVLSRMVRSMLYTDTPLRVALSGLSSSLGGLTEHTQRWGVSQQRFFTNEINQEWLYLSILEFWLETEIR